MCYCESGEIRIRDMRKEDAAIITEEEIAQGWHQTIEKYEERLRDRDAGKAISLVAEYRGNVAGYVNVYPDADRGAFGGKGYPEIVDLGVLEKYRGRGIGTKLMEEAERVASNYADGVYLGVGLHSGYGSAQRLYIKRGYIPDGSGVWYADHVCEPYTQCCNDDDLVLYLWKKLR